MLLTCEKCQSVWRLEEKHLALGGRVVRCTTCGNTWFEKQVVVPGLTPDPEAEPDTAAPNFSDMLADEMADTLPADDGKSRAVTPITPAAHELPPMEHLPGGLGATAFGGMVFLLLFFVTLAGVFALKAHIVRLVPASVALYEAAGVHLTAPGEGLTLSGLSAHMSGARIDLTGKVQNGSAAPIAYPGFHVTLRGKDGDFLKEWKIVAADSQLAPGDTIPLELHFKDIPDGASSLEVKVMGR